MLEKHAADESLLAGELVPGERVAWAGCPDTSIIFHHEDYLAVPASLLWGAFAIFWLLGASGWVDFFGSGHGSFTWFPVIWGTPFVVVGQYLIWGRFIYSRWLRGRTFYALTNKRAIVIRRGLHGRSCRSVYLENLAMLDKHNEGDEKGAISFGGPFTGEFFNGPLMRGGWGRNSPPRALTFDDLPEVAIPYQVALGLYEKARTAR